MGDVSRNSQPPIMSLGTADKTVRMTCAQAVIEFFQNQHVEQLDGSMQPMVYGYWGIFGHGNVCGIGQALEERHPDKLNYFRGQNEQGMALAAMAYAKQTRNRRVCAVTSSIGPGATNMITAAACAHSNRIPMLILPGDIFSTRRPHPVLQQLEDVKQNYSVNECFKPVSVFFDRIFRPEQLLDCLPKAAKISTYAIIKESTVLTDPAQYGPVVLSLPQDLQAEAFDFPVSLFVPREHRLRRARPDSHEVNMLVDLLKGAKRPLFLVGGGVHYSGAGEIMEKLVANSKIPFCESQAGKGAVPESELSLGGVGVTGTKCANELLSKADLLVSFGCRLGDFVTSSNSGISRTCNLVGVNVNPTDAQKLGAHAVVADIKTVLEIVTSSDVIKNYKVPDAYASEVAKAKAEWLTIRKQLCAVPTSDSLAVDAVNQAMTKFARGGVVVCAAGGLPGELHKMWQCWAGKADYHVEYAYSCMGYEVAGAVGAKMAAPEKEVFSLVGDGSWLMMHTEIVSARKLGYPINIVLVDNCGFGCIHRLQAGSGIREFGNLQSHGVDFVKNAEALGVEICVRVGSPTKLHDAILEQCTPANFNKCKLFLVETDPDITSPGYSWWDCAPPAVGTGSTCKENITAARGKYSAKVGTIESRL